MRKRRQERKKSKKEIYINEEVKEKGCEKRQGKIRRWKIKRSKRNDTITQEVKRSKSMVKKKRQGIKGLITVINRKMEKKDRTRKETII